MSQTVLGQFMISEAVDVATCNSVISEAIAVADGVVVAKDVVSGVGCG
jgi:hypothetical protein